MTLLIVGLTAAIGGAVVGGVSSKASGGSFWKGAITGAAAGAGLGTAGLLGGVIGGAVSGGIVSKSEGGSFARGAIGGGIGGVFGGLGAGISTGMNTAGIERRKEEARLTKEFEDSLNANYNNSVRGDSDSEDRYRRLRNLAAAENNQTNILSLNPQTGGRATTRYTTTGLGAGPTLSVA